MMAEGSSNGGAQAVDMFHGYMYRFRMTTTTREAEFEVDGAVACAGDCAYCPIFNSRKCLWNTRIDQYIDAGGSTQNCPDACTDDNGCVRTEDCNRCDDRLCSVCTNFDAGISIC
jgi:hypothetical protein